MFKKAKQSFEQWLRQLISDEVAKIDTNLQRERAFFDAQLESFRLQFDAALAKLIANSNPHQENIELRRVNKELVQLGAEVCHAVQKLHPTIKV
jgi:hypothetical protein